MFLEEAFNLNETLKETLVKDYGAILARTNFYDVFSGFVTPFYETEIIWGIPYDDPKIQELIDGAVQEILKIQDEFILNKLGNMYDPTLEGMSDNPIIVYSIDDFFRFSDK